MYIYAQAHANTMGRDCTHAPIEQVPGLRPAQLLPSLADRAIGDGWSVERKGPRELMLPGLADAMGMARDPSMDHVNICIYIYIYLYAYYIHIYIYIYVYIYEICMYACMYLSMHVLASAHCLWLVPVLGPLHGYEA